MWPILLDMTREESMQNLRCLELDAFAGLVTAFRAQGCLNPEKLQLLKATGSMLNISLDRHKAEIRRAVNDEKLNTIAYHTAGHKTSMEDWTQEGRRLIPLLSRVAPQTVYSAIADEVADTANRANKLLPHLACTERKRSAPTSPTPVSPTDRTFRANPEGGTPKVDDCKKRKVSPSGGDVVSSASGSQLMGPPKGNRAQPMNRLRAKIKHIDIKQKDNLQLLKIRQQHAAADIDRPSQLTTSYPQSTKMQVSGCNFPAKTSQSLPIAGHLNNSSLGTLNALQNIAIQPFKTSSKIIDIATNLTAPMDTNSSFNPDFRSSSSTSVSVPPHLDHNKPCLPKTLLPNKLIKVCPPRKTVTTSTGQKLVVVSNPQSIPSTSILQRTLTIPFVKNISVKNYDKFKIVPPASTMQLSPLFTSNTTTGLNHFINNTKHKVRTNGSGHKVLPFSQIQILNTKGAIKVLPFGSKLLSKPATTSSTSHTNPIYLLNSVAKTDTITTSPQMVTIKTMPSEIMVNSAVSSSSNAMLQSFGTDFESEIAQHTIASASSVPSVDGSTSSECSSEATTHGPTVKQNHINLDSVSNHVVEEEGEEGDEEEEEENDDEDEGEDVDTEDGDTNDSYKIEEHVIVAEEQPFYMFENEHTVVEAEVPIEQSAPCVVEQLHPFPFSHLDSSDAVESQEELVSLECEPTVNSGIITDTDADDSLDFNTFES